MAKYRKNQAAIEAITFDEFIEYGKNNGGNIVNGMPWSFKYNGQPVTHENDERYLIPTPQGVVNFTPNDMLITGVNGEIYPCKNDIFEAEYEAVNEFLSQKERIDKMNEALVKIARAVKLEAFAFNELASTVYETALEAMGVDNVQ